jgi:hypothetical protein
MNISASASLVPQLTRTFSFQYNPITANHLGIILGVFLGSRANYYQDNIMINMELIDTSLIPAASCECLQCNLLCPAKIILTTSEFRNRLYID